MGVLGSAGIHVRGGADTGVRGHVDIHVQSSYFGMYSTRV